MSATLVVIPRPKLLFLWLLDCMLAFHAPNYSSHYYTNSLTLCRRGQQTLQPLPSLYRKALTHSLMHLCIFSTLNCCFYLVQLWFCLFWCFYCFFFAFIHVFIWVYWLFLIRFETFRCICIFLCMECFKCSIIITLMTILIMPLSSRRRKRRATIIFKNAALSSVI